MADTRIIKRIWNPTADEWLELPKPIALVGGIDLESFVAGYQQRLAEEQAAQPLPPPATWLTSSDPEPRAGTMVEAEDGIRWWRDATHIGAACNWFPESELTNPDRHDPESWTKVAGNYGPVRIVLEV